MNTEQLKKILVEYPPNRTLRIIVDKEPLHEMTVGEMLLKLPDEQPEGMSPHAFMTIFGRDSIIIRERFEDLDAPPGAVQTRQWLEIDLR